MEEKAIYPGLSYKIMGCAFKTFNDNGFGMSEKFYQNALSQSFQAENLNFQKECKVVKELDKNNIIRWFLDFVVENKIVVELKVRPRLGYTHIKQVVEYLKVSGYRLAILIYFTRDGVKFRRVLNSY